MENTREPSPRWRRFLDATSDEERAMDVEPEADPANLELADDDTLLADARGLEREAALVALNGPYSESLPARYRRAAAALRWVVIKRSGLATDQG